MDVARLPALLAPHSAWWLGLLLPSGVTGGVGARLGSRGRL